MNDRVTPRFVAFIAATLLAACTTDATKDEEPVPPATEAAPSAEATPKIPTLWQADTEYRYALSLDNRTTLGGGVLAEFDLDGKLTLSGRHLDDGVQFRAQVTEARFNAVDPEQQAKFDELAQELSHPLSFKLKNHRLAEIRLRKGASPFAVSLSRAIVAALQIAPPPDKSSPRWTSVEQDASGDYQAEYSREATGSRISKRKVEYQDLSLGAVGPDKKETTVETQIVKSTGHVDLVDERITEVAYDEVLRVDSFPGTPAVASTQLKLVLEHQGKASAPPDWAALEQSTQRVGRVTRETSSAHDPRYDTQRIGDYSFETALKELEEHSRDPKRKEIGRKKDERLTALQRDERRKRLDAQGKVFTAMSAILRSQPETVKRADRAIRSGSDATGMLLNALGTAGSPASQAALVALMDDAKLDINIRRGAAYALIRTATATPQTVTALSKHLDGGPVQQHALYGLGTIARGLLEAGEGERATAIVKQLIARLEAAELDIEKVGTMRAIANSANPLALSTVEPYLENTDPRLRSAAVDAVRLMDDPKVDAIVAARLTQDDARGVQLAAVEAIRVREPSDVLATALTDCVQGPAKSNVKLKAIDVLRGWLPARPETRKNLERIAAENELAPMRAAARRALAD